MVKDVALDFLVVDPLLVVTEGINLQRHAKLGGLQLSHHHGEVVVQLRVVVDVGFDIGAEDAEVGLLATVHDHARVDTVGFVVFEDVFLFLGDVVFHQGVLLVFLQHLGRTVADSVHVDVDGARDAAATRLRHAAPVGEGRRYHGIGGYGGDGEIPGNVHFKLSAHAGHSNPASAKMLEQNGLDSLNPVRDLQIPMIASIRNATCMSLDLHTENPKSTGGFIRHYEVPDFIRVAAPVYLKTGGSVAANHNWDTTESEARARIKQVILVKRMIDEYYPDAIASPDKSDDLAVPE